MAGRDDELEFFALHTPDEVEAERHRLLSFRTFLVAVPAGPPERVVAHYWTNENPAGHLNFYTITPGGRHIIRDSYHYGEYTRVREITAVETNRYIDACYIESKRAQHQDQLEPHRRRPEPRVQ